MTRRAVVLGGGGVVGIAWATGALAGYTDAGLDLVAADVIVGTSAGSFAGAYLAADAVDEWYQAQIRGTGHEVHADLAPEFLRNFEAAVTAGGGDRIEVGRSLGRFATAATTISRAERGDVVASRLPGTEWPGGTLRLTVIDADTGELHQLDRASGVPFAVAAEASGAAPGVWPVVEEGGRRWIDGGSFSATNADQALGYDVVLVIAPMPSGLPGMPHVDGEVAMLERSGSAVHLLVPDAGSIEAQGENPFDPLARARSAVEGRRQATEAAASAAALWNVPAPTKGPR